MPMALGPAITRGRELFSEPKKNATVDFDRDDDRIEVAVERRPRRRDCIQFQPIDGVQPPL